jgi:hypothetical protein
MRGMELGHRDQQRPMRRRGHGIDPCMATGMQIDVGRRINVISSHDCIIQHFQTGTASRTCTIVRKQNRSICNIFKLVNGNKR